MKKKQQLNIRFHDPNVEAVSTAQIAKIFIEASRLKFEQVLQEQFHNDSVEQQELA